MCASQSIVWICSVDGAVVGVSGGVGFVGSEVGWLGQQYIFAGWGEADALCRTEGGMEWSAARGR